MTKDDIIRMARESGMDVDNEASDWGEIIIAEPADLKRFAALVAAAAVEREREACARVCLDMQNGWASDDHLQCADAIRARGQA